MNVISELQHKASNDDSVFRNESRFLSAKERVNGQKVLSRLNDELIRKLFSPLGDKKHLLGFINSIFVQAGGDLKIHQADALAEDIRRENIDDVLVKLDFLLKSSEFGSVDNTKEAKKARIPILINLEVQRWNKSNMSKRSIIYISKMLNCLYTRDYKQLRDAQNSNLSAYEKERYDSTNYYASAWPCIMINLLDYDVPGAKSQPDTYVHCQRLVNLDTVDGESIIEVYTIEAKKWARCHKNCVKASDYKTEFDRIMLFLTKLHSHLEEEIAKVDPIIAGLIEMEKEFYNNKEDYNRAISAEQRHAELSEAIAIGREEGIEEGRDECILAMKKIKELFVDQKLSMSEVQKRTGFPPQFIDKCINTMKSLGVSLNVPV